MNGGMEMQMEDQAYTHNLNLASLYETINGEEPELTTRKGEELLCDQDGPVYPHVYQDGFHGCLDYVFYTENRGMTPLGCLPLPTLQECGKEGFPNKYHPSDHLPIGGVFQFQG